jgi:hypothetical protein
MNQAMPKLVAIVDESNFTGKLVNLEKLDNFALEVKVIKFASILLLRSS